jgi:chemotaxis protein methyltransferase CheR
MTLTTENFSYVADLVRRRSAISLAPGKEYLVESRLLPLARRAGKSVDEYVVGLRRGVAPTLEVEMIVEAMTTNETSWFRDIQPFEALTQHIVPTLLAERKFVPSLRIWSAACSTGQEPYSIAMTLAEEFPQGPRFDITATDLSNEVLDRARSGLFTQLEVNRGLAAKHLVQHFSRRGTQWAISDDLRSRVSFHKHNLMDAPMPGPFDIVFIRNVLIYFEMPVKQEILRKLRSVVRPGGFLVLGAAETTVGVDAGWARVPVGRSAVYQLQSGRTT